MKVLKFELQLSLVIRTAYAEQRRVQHGCQHAEITTTSVFPYYYLVLARELRSIASVDLSYNRLYREGAFTRLPVSPKTDVPDDGCRILFSIIIIIIIIYYIIMIIIVVIYIYYYNIFYILQYYTFVRSLYTCH